jgi:hypothetical protein
MAATPWWKDPVTQGYNPPIEPGQDIGTPYHTPVTALLPGTVAGVSYGGFGARVDVTTAQGDVYYQHLDTVATGVRKGASVTAGEDLGLSGGQLYGGQLPNSPLNSTGPHIEVGLLQGDRSVNPSALIAAGPQASAFGLAAGQPATGIGSAGPPPGAPGSATAPVVSAPAQQSSGGGLVNLSVSPQINFPDPIASLQAWVASGVSQAKSNLSSGQGFIGQNIVPLAVAAVIILIVLGSGQKTQQAPAPQIVPVPV